MTPKKTPIAAIAFCAAFAICSPGLAQSLSILEERAAQIDELLDELAQPDLETWEATENRIVGLWSRSGSETIDLLLERGQNALEAEDYQTAIEHLTAVTDHAPDFAEGWQLRATAFFSLGEYGLALDDLETALRLNPKHFGALAGLGVVLEEAGNFEVALKAFEYARELNPHRELITDAIERLESRLGKARL